VLSTVRPFTVTSPSVPAVKITRVNGMRAMFVGASCAPGCVPDETVSPVPGVVIGPGVGGGVPPPPPVAIELYFACDSGPKYPTAGETPFAACHLATADLVNDPKYVVSLPGEPEPLAATWYPEEFRYC
ncbi:MAG TPA: hypothetical protein VJJ73_00105, partial [Candidatus Paceibacterota bacterium]